MLLVISQSRIAGHAVERFNVKTVSRKSLVSVAHARVRALRHGGVWPRAGLFRVGVLVGDRREKGRRRYVRIADSVGVEPWDNDLLATFVRLAAHMNTRWARDGLTADEAGIATLCKADLMRVTGKRRDDVALTLAQRLADVTSTSVERRGDVTVIRWPKFVQFQGYMPENAGNLPASRPASRVPRPRPAKREETSRVSSPKTATNSGGSNGSGSNGNGEIPAKWREVADYLKTSPNLNRPKLYNWPWWDRLDAIYPGDTGPDVLKELAKMDEWLTRNPRRKYHDWPKFVSNWLARAEESS